MAAPTFRAANSATTANGTSVVVTKPTGTTSGDVLIANLAYSNIPGSDTITPPSGFTSVDAGTSSTNCSSNVFYKVAGGSEPGTYTFSTASNAHLSVTLVAYSAADNTSPIGNHSNKSITSATTAVSFTALSANTYSGIVILCTGLRNTSSSTTHITAAGTGQTVRSDTVSTTSAFMESSIIEGATVAAGGTPTINNATASTSSTQGNVAFVLQGVIDQPPSAPTLSSPTNAGTVSTTTPTLQWSDTDPDSDAISYEAQIDTVNTFDSNSAVSLASSTSQTLNQNIGNGGTTTGMAEAFQPSSTGILGTVQIDLAKNGSPPGNIVSKIYSSTGTYGTNAAPSGSALAVSDNLAASTLSTSNGLVTFTFSGSNNINLTSGSTYVVSVEYSAGDSSNYVMVGYSTDNYSGNDSILSSGTWQFPGTSDVHFSVNTLATPLIDALSSANNGFADVTTPVTPSISHVQKIGSASDNSISSFTVTPGTATTAGNDIIVAVSWYVSSGAYPTCTITDSAGNTYNTLYSFTGSSGTGPSMLIAQAHYTKALTTSQHITATFTGTAPFATMLAHEFSGLSGILDGSVVTASGTGTVMSFGSLTTTNAVDGVLAFVAPFGNLVAPTWSSGWSSNDWQSAGPSIGMAYQLPTSTGSFSGTATIAASEIWNSVVIALQGSVGDPFTSGDSVSYTVQAGSALTNGNTYYWRVRGTDPAGSNTYGSWSATDSFTVSTGSGGGGNTTNFFQFM